MCARFASSLPGDRLGRVARLPVAEQLADVVLEPLPIEVAGHAQDRAVAADSARRSASRISSSRSARAPARRPGSSGPRDRDSDGGAARASPFGPARPRSRAVPAARPCRAGSSWSSGKCGRRNRSAIDLQRRQQVAGQRGAAEAGMAGRNRFAALDPQVFQVLNELAAVALARAAQRQFAGERRPARLAWPDRRRSRRAPER